jgi:hypothetical protein
LVGEDGEALEAQDAVVGVGVLGARGVHGDGELVAVGFSRGRAWVISIEMSIDVR